ncbi:MAG TPA: DegT/DnrJ/EryC1/StrS family aminotransferase [Clostridia bacterium]|jgi:dTDP-4-amino-4,6-dideoxygalactose transaminase
MYIPFTKPEITQDEIQAVVDVLKSGWITTGPVTKQFESQIAQYCGVEKACCINSATAGLEFALRYLGIGEGDEVIVCAYTYTASASVIYHCGAKAVFCDVAKDTYNFDYERLEDLINQKTKAIIAVDIAGELADYDKLYEIAERKKHLFKSGNDIQAALGRVAIIADAAHSLGAQKDSKKSGAFADFTSFSFHAVKNLTTAEGGALTWTFKGEDKEQIYKKIMLLSLHGQTKDAYNKTAGNWEYDIVAPLYKCNMTDILAALGVSQLKRYEDILARRKAIFEQYKNLLSANKKIDLFDHKYSSYHLILARVEDIGEKERNEIIIKMAERGIICNVHYKPLPLLSAYKNLGFDIKDYPNSYNQYKNQITLPLFNQLTKEEVEYICENFVDIAEQYV